MDLQDRAEHKAFREEVRQFLKENKHLAPGESAFSFRMRPRNLAGEVRTWQGLLVDHGYTSRTIPKAYGGFGAEPDILKSRIIADEFFAANVIQGLGNQGISMLVPTLLEHGTEEQKQRYIRPTIRSEIVWCQGYSEPNAGSDLASLQTSGVEDGDDFIINGQKIWTSGAHIADMIFCLVRTEPDAPKHEGISYIVFPMDTPGIEVRPLQTMTGTPSFNEVFFTDVRVPQANVVGGRGNGWVVANSTLKHERGLLGDANRSLDSLLRVGKLLQNESLDGHPLMENPLFRDRFIRLQARVQAMRLHEMRMITDAGKGKGRGLGDMVVKLLGCELNHQLDGLGIDILGEIGVLYDNSPMLRDGGAWQANFMFDLGLIIGGGTAQIQKNIISERGLGMPREPKVAGA
ncbi:MAG: acyl-CoA dehydrogenase family protein [Alphaproteobacteria bacterium]|jgi:alkylation response protein AidB-like acyl-CoA dehydrogenase|nr:acyl-CoA dehydrogenase family protein [Alphaproteobacteria bacterium]MDP6564899.1 acyl-CoA dehydrogenase family protein [Alphaproteobacteria bacterium]